MVTGGWRGWGRVSMWRPWVHGRAQLPGGRTRWAPEEWEQGHLPNSQLLTPELKFEMLDSWPKDTPILFYSNSGRRGLETASYFVAYGFIYVRNLAGGLKAWRSQQSHSDELVQWEN